MKRWDEIEAGVRAQLRAALESEAPFVGLRVELPRSSASPLAALGLFEASDEGERFYAESPVRDLQIAGLGALCRVEASGSERFATGAREARAALAALLLVSSGASDEESEAAGPLLVGGFAFGDAPAAQGVRAVSDWEGFAPLSFVLPRITWMRSGERSWVTVSIARSAPTATASEAEEQLRSAFEYALDRVAAASSASQRAPSCANEYCARPDRPHADYLAAVEDALGALGRGDLEKVVLARSLVVESDIAYEVPAVLSALREAHRACTVFAVARGERIFVGATPEQLLRVEGTHVTTSAVAGSAPRGRSPEEDERLARTLRESKKEQEEHAVVVREIEAALAPFCSRVEHAEAPAVLGLDGIQHLETRFVAELRTAGAERPGVLELAGALHPTPAICGTPRLQAAAWIDRAEQLERGWYAGAIGWLDARGGGELSVALRSGLMESGRARLYAGAGIVVGSDPHAELAETRLKLRALLSQLTEI